MAKLFIEGTNEMDEVEERLMCCPAMERCDSLDKEACRKVPVR